VLARELSLDEIRAIRSQTDCELEMFVHGALCVSYSGQCFSSEAWGGRSANRGQCAQACRLPYDLIVDGAQRPWATRATCSRPATSTRCTRCRRSCNRRVGAQDRGALQGRRLRGADHRRLSPGRGRSVGRAAAEHHPPGAELRLEQVFSRGLGAYFVTGTDHQAVVRGRTPRHRGVLMGKVAR
jgi:putative protease